jgi:hypothetical protein
MMKPRYVKTVIVVAAALALGVPGAVHAQSGDGVRFAQVQKKKRVVTQRAPTRIIVRPGIRNRHDSTEFPRADNLGFPGRNAVRQCVSWLRTEYRPSGTVVTPQMRCWWQRG